MTAGVPFVILACPDSHNAQHMEMAVPTLESPDSFDEIKSNALRLRDWLGTRSEDIEAARQLPGDVVDVLREAGMFRLNMPKSWGGPELTSPQQVEVIEALSRGDASVGWCVMIGCDSGIYSGYLEDRVARDLYPHLDMVQAGWVQPAGRADEVADGYKVSGQWMFCSGSTHADLVAAGVTVYKDGEPKLGPSGMPEWRLVIAPRNHWRFEDTWHTTGLRGTASQHYTTHEDYLVIPREHSFSFLEPRREGLLWKRPDTLLRKMSGIPLGLSRQLIDEATDIMKNKEDKRAGALYRENPRIQAAVAEAEMVLGRARAYVYDSLECQWAHLENDTEPNQQERANVWLSRVNAFQAARQIANSLYDVIGGDAIYSRQSLADRGLRDATTMCQHVVGQMRGLEDVGALLLDAKTQSPMVML